MVFAILGFIVALMCLIAVINLRSCIKKEFRYYGKYSRIEENVVSFKDSIKNTDFPIIKFTIGSKRYGFILDTGANMNCIDMEALEEVKDSIVDTKEGTVINSVHGRSKESEACKIDFSYGKSKFSEWFQPVNMKSPFESINKTGNVNLIGIIGNDFFQKYRWSIDFDRMVVWMK